MKLTYKVALISVFSVFAFFFSVDTAQAARIFFTPAVGQYSVGSDLKVQVRLDSEGQSINAAELHLSFTKASLQVQSISKVGSIFTLWPEEPTYSNTNGSISITGGVPNGTTTSNGLIATLTFRPIAIGQGSLAVAPGSSVLLNDGYGTLASLKAGQGQYTLVARPATPVPSSVVSPAPSETPSPSMTPEPSSDFSDDKTSPERFKIFIGNDQRIFDGRWYVLFSAFDAYSGLEHYELQEEKPWQWLLNLFRGEVIVESPRIAKNPYLLGDQSLWSTITVWAYDHNGNVRVSKLRPWLQKPLVIGLGLALLGGVFYGCMKLWKIKLRRKK